MSWLAPLLEAGSCLSWYLSGPIGLKPWDHPPKVIRLAIQFLLGCSLSPAIPTLGKVQPGALIGIVLSMDQFEKNDIFIILGFPIHEHDIFLPLLSFL